MQQDEVQLLNFSSIPCPETIFYAKYEIQNSGNETALQDLYDFETSLKNKSQICCVLDGSLYLYAFDSIPLLPEPRPSMLVLNDSGSLGRSFFQHKTISITYLIQVNFVQALRRLSVYHLCKEYGFLSLKEFLVPIRAASTFCLEGLDVYEYPLLGLHIGFLTNGSMEFSFRPTGLSLYCLSNIANLEDYVSKEVVVLPFGCKAKLISFQAPSSILTIETLQNRYGFSNLSITKWVGIQVDFLDYAFSWPLCLCFLIKTPFSTRLVNDFDKYFSAEAYSFPFYASKDMLSKECTHMDQDKTKVYSNSENLGHTASACAPLKPELPNPLAIPSSPQLPIHETNDPFPSAENGMEEVDRGNDLLMEDIEEAGITEADFDYFDLPTHEVNSYPQNMEEIEQKSESLNQVGLESFLEETQVDRQRLPLSPKTFTQENNIATKTLSKSPSELAIPKAPLKSPSMDDSNIESYFHDEVVPPQYNAIPISSSSINIAKKYSIGGKYWCPSDLLHRSDSLGSLTNSVSSVEEEKHLYDNLRETIKHQPNSGLELSIQTRVSFPSLETKSAKLLSPSSFNSDTDVTKINDSFEPLLDDYNLKHLKMIKEEALLEIMLSQPFYFYLLPFWRNQNSDYISCNDSHDYLYIQEATKGFLEDLFSGLSRRISLRSCASRETEMNGNGTKGVDVANTYLINVNQPGVILKSNNQKLTVDFNATKHWLSLNLQPLDEKRNYRVLLFTQEKPESITLVKSLFDDIRFAYENSYFGKLEFGNLVTLQKNGIIDYDSPCLKSFSESGDQFNEQQSTSISDLAKECANVYSNDNVLVLFFVDDSVRSFFSTCQLFTLFNEVISNETKKAGLLNDKLFLRIIPSSAVCAIGQPLAMKDLSPTTIALDIYSTPPLNNSSFKAKFRPFAVEKPIGTLLDYKLANTNSASALFNDYTLHVTYTIVLNKYLLCNWSDTYGELEHIKWFLLSETDSMVDVFQKIWRTSNEIMKIGSFSWCLSIMKVGVLSLEELNAWKQVADSQEFMDKSTFVIGNCLIYDIFKPCIKPFFNILFRSCNNPCNSLQTPENIEIAGIVREAATLVPNFNALNINPCLAYGLLGHSKCGYVVPVANIQLFHLKQSEPTLVLRKILREYMFMSSSSIKNHYSSVPIPHNISTVLYQGQLLDYLRGGDH
ncbi:mediator complex subunit Med13 [Schizosaccharomyces osmophilus]|uniref:Mediator of RNA polymerase II transcription subunit 13 n=1 Tax=Schizosaccharomyces osmophilus TaxID=2545709 RepID=A0AAE9WA35_9SCHI|nr:mediator complex subunit Med13 [Schizosaccharomyces osmophilus]WBW71601.1 mediator complex subunit Med13 [Schizosaccharomyces osmophilus]